MKEIDVVIKDYKNTNLSGEPHTSKFVFRFKEDDIVRDLIESLNLEGEDYFVVSGSRSFENYDYLYTEDGIIWDVNIESSKIEHVQYTFPERPIEIILNIDGIGSAGGLIGNIAMDVFISLVASGVIYLGSKMGRKVIAYKNKEELLSIEEIFNFVENHYNVPHPAALYNSMFNRVVWDLNEFSDLYKTSRDMGKSLLMSVGYDEIKSTEVYKLNKQKKEKFLQEVEKVETDIFEKNENLA